MDFCTGGCPVSNAALIMIQDVFVQPDGKCSFARQSVPLSIILTK